MSFFSDIISVGAKAVGGLFGGDSGGGGSQQVIQTQRPPTATENLLGIRKLHQQGKPNKRSRKTSYDKDAMRQLAEQYANMFKE